MVTKKYCWLMLLLAIILEITGTALMKFFAIKGGMEGYILMLLFIFCSYFALSKAIVKIPISTAYAIWEGIGLIGTATVAYFIFNEDLSLLKVLAFMVILSGLIMIKKELILFQINNGVEYYVRRYDWYFIDYWFCIFDVLANICLKKSQGFKYKLYGFLAISLVGFAFLCLAYAISIMDLSIAYALFGACGLLFNYNY